MRKAVYVVLGLLFAFFLFANLFNAPHKRETDDLNRKNAERIITALRAYQHDHGKFPENLDALDPAYLAPVPRRVIHPGDKDGSPFEYESKEGGKSFRLGYMEAAMGAMPSDSGFTFDSASGAWKNVQY